MTDHYVYLKPSPHPKPSLYPKPDPPDTSGHVSRAADHFGVYLQKQVSQKAWHSGYIWSLIQMTSGRQKSQFKSNDKFKIRINFAKTGFPKGPSWQPG